MSDFFDKPPELFKTTEQFKWEIIEASKIAVEQLVKVLKEDIITGTEDDVSVDRLKSAVQTKKIAMFDALEMVTRIDIEQQNLNEGDSPKGNTGFAERNSKSSGK